MIGAENDVAFALLLFTLFTGLLWLTTGRLGYLVGGLALFAAGAVAAGRVIAHVHDRFLIWFDAGRYATGDLREVYFYPDELKGHTARVYHPGE